MHETQSNEPAVQYEEIVYVEPGSEQVVEMSTTENTTDQTAEYQEVVVQEPLPPDHEQVHSVSVPLIRDFEMKK